MAWLETLYICTVGTTYSSGPLEFEVAIISLFRIIYQLELSSSKDVVPLVASQNVLGTGDFPLPRTFYTLKVFGNNE